MALANERIITLDDFSQLQALLDYEQQERDKHIMQCHHNRSPMAPSLHKRRHQQFRRAINPQASLQSSLERARLAEASMRLKRMRTQYKRRRTLEVQIYLDNYRRQALVRAVLPEEEELYYRQCIAAALEARRVQACLQEYLFLANQEPVVEDDTEGYDAYRTLQLETLLRHLFNQQTQEDIEFTPKSELEEAEDMAEVWKLLSNQKTNYETPRSAFLAPDHDQKEGYVHNEPTGDNKAEEIKHSNEEADDKNFDYDIDFPPLQKHVVPLQDLIQRLASEPVLIGEQQTHFSDEPKPSGIWAKKSHAKSPPPPPLSTQTEDKKATFLPQHIFTEAEPTPTLENMPNTPLGQEEEGEESQHFVNSVAAEQKNEIVPPDPKKTKMLEELESIKHQLQDDDSELVKRWKHVLQGGDDGSQHLEFSKQQQGTLVLTATTGFNRQFLGSEDELVRTLIRLDAIDSMGDECIRKKRKSLVKTCESMLDKLDAYKQTQWEKAIVK
ncbi:uncharacterized protein EV154DRAFT_470508 [Mucor mucedo]|uniref:uncharacterized protein n=1 Tax=Mucor mucedo TaxID=29922 RepID=UPI002220561F|nr:uncharacterized protein EV154DRAFT_470508 [Mucor mucedo]KAI7886407.1 hypothetical protein EV154DRAFT_470508 [Mucor mucedo]